MEPKSQDRDTKPDIKKPKKSAYQIPSVPPGKESKIDFTDIDKRPDVIILDDDGEV